MANVALLPSLVARRTRARELIEEINEFATATGALEWLFHEPSDEKLRVLELILHWQNRDAGDELDAVVADYEAPGDDSACEEARHASISRDTVLFVMGKPALLFATSIYDEDLATLIWRGLVAVHRAHPQFNLLLQAMDNTRDSHGLSSLHYAIEAEMPAFVTEVCAFLAQLDAVAFRRAVTAVRSQDIVLPMAAKQITGRSITSGGCTLLHLAARKGDLDAMKLLVEEPIALDVEAVGTDWDTLTVRELAVLHGREEVIRYLEASVNAGGSSTQPDRESLQRERDERATARYTASMIATEPMTRREVFASIWSQEQCEQVLSVLEKVTQTRGWSKQRHTSYPTTDLPCYQVASIDAWVRSSIRQRLFSQVYERYEIPATKVLTFRELFYVKYEARVGEQAELALHCDGSVLSFNILLNPRDEFSGGGTYFEEAAVTVHIDQGDAVVHSGKVRHAGAAVTHGKRTILVGFLDLVDRVAV